MTCQHNEWTNREIAILTVLWPDASQAAIEAALPRHPFMSCRNKAQDLKISRRAVYRDWRAIAAQYRSKSVFDFARNAE